MVPHVPKLPDLDSSGCNLPEKRNSDNNGLVDAVQACNCSEKSSDFYRRAWQNGLTYNKAIEKSYD